MSAWARRQSSIALTPVPHLPSAPDVPRRNIVVGRAIGTNRNGGPHHAAVGLPIQDAALLPFLITARAQGQLAQSAGTRAFFAEGLASSYEAFHHTREGRLAAKDLDDGLEADDKGCSWMVPTFTFPVGVFMS